MKENDKSLIYVFYVFSKYYHIYLLLLNSYQIFQSIHKQNAILKTCKNVLVYKQNNGGNHNNSLMKFDS